jgi:hypothetical protein
MPGINPVTYPADLAAAAFDLGTNTATAPAVSAEPPLACYVTASCGTGGAQPVTSKKSAKCKKRKRRHHASASKHRRCKKKRHKHH